MTLKCACGVQILFGVTV